jgi:hypothetical protein
MNIYKVTTVYADGEYDVYVFASSLPLSAVTRGAQTSGFNFASITVECLS